MKGRFEIRIAGSGGQGTIVATEIIAHAAALYEKDLYVAQTKSIGPEARGGKSRAELVISKEPIDYPKIIAANLQIILTQLATEYAFDTSPEGRIIYDDFFVENIPGREEGKPRIDAKYYHLPIVKTAREKVGKEITTNMVALGTAARVMELENVMSPDSIRKSITEHFPDKKDINLQAFDEGYKLFKETKPT